MVEIDKYIDHVQHKTAIPAVGFAIGLIAIKELLEKWEEGMKLNNCYDSFTAHLESKIEGVEEAVNIMMLSIRQPEE